MALVFVPTLENEHHENSDGEPAKYTLGCLYIETKIVGEVTRIRLYFDFPTFSPDIPESNNTYRQFRQHPKPVKRILLPAKNILLIISLYSRVVL